MAERRRLPDRRLCRTFQFTHHSGEGSQHYLVTVGYHEVPTTSSAGVPGELFINTEGRSGSLMDTLVSEAATAASLALQYGCPVDVLRDAMKRNPDKTPMGVLGHALDLILSTDAPTGDNDG